MAGRKYEQDRSKVHKQSINFEWLYPLPAVYQGGEVNVYSPILAWSSGNHRCRNPLADWLCRFPQEVNEN